MECPNFIRFFTSNLDVQESDVSDLLNQCERLTIKKNYVLLNQGEFSKHTFFVEKGLLRQFALNENGKEHILSFAPENWLVTDRDSAYFNQPSIYSIQALEDSLVVLIDQSFIDKLTQLVPGFTAYNNRLLHNHIRHLQDRIGLLLSATAEERYLNFVQMYPDVLMRVPQTMVASYLGITPESLSRVRKEIAHKKSE
ncbi:MAG: Crp/Fnr family transcriptional regulator [Crocinitomicaceae bacterium]|nr:Crp/Fnr family transcriptional regulator [Crocinitomicaceae bacterium]